MLTKGRVYQFICFVAQFVMCPIYCVSQSPTLMDRYTEFEAASKSSEAGRICKKVLIDFDRRLLIAGENHTFALAAAWASHCRLSKPIEPRFGGGPERYSRRGVQRFVEVAEARLRIRFPDWWVSLMHDVNADVSRDDLKWINYKDVLIKDGVTGVFSEDDGTRVELAKDLLTWVVDRNVDMFSRVGRFAVCKFDDCSFLLSEPDFHGCFRIVGLNESQNVALWQNSGWGIGEGPEFGSGPMQVFTPSVSVVCNAQFVTVFGVIRRGFSRNDDRLVVAGDQQTAVFYIEQFARSNGSPTFRFASNLWQIYDSPTSRRMKEKRTR